MVTKTGVKRHLLVYSLVMLTLFTVSAASLQTLNIGGNLQTDFSPEEVVVIRGTGFNHNALVLVEVTRPDLHVDSYLALTNSIGTFKTYYILDGITGEYKIYASDGIHIEEITFTDAAIWTTKNDCGNSTQDVNHFSIGDRVYINGNGFASDDYDWEIKGKPGGASCDPNAVVASGTKAVDVSGAFCFNAYNVSSGDCGEYQVKFDVKGDNYRVEGNACTRNSQCGTSSSQLICQNLDVINETTAPACIGGICNITINNTYVETCGPASSSLICIGNNSVNVSITPGCTEGSCFNVTNYAINEECSYRCLNGSCVYPVCGNGIKEGDEQCDDGNLINGDGCDANCNFEIACYNNTDCGADFASDDFCIGDNVAVEITEFTCHNPGTSKSYCSNSTSTNVTKQCEESCLDGNCVRDCELEDEDNDGVNDCDDLCPNSTPNEPVDKHGCDIFEFCSRFSCGFDCYTADWNNNERVLYPKDCKVVVVLRNGQPQQPICVPTEFSNVCAG
jgi:cysteine-rich repeat protein